MLLRLSKVRQSDGESHRESVQGFMRRGNSAAHWFFTQFLKCRLMRSSLKPLETIVRHRSVSALIANSHQLHLNLDRQEEVCDRDRHLKLK